MSPNVRVNPYAAVEESVLFDGVEIGCHARIRRAIIDKEVRIPPHFVVGYDRDEDRERFTVTESGIVVIPKREPIELSEAVPTPARHFRKRDAVRIA